MATQVLKLDSDSDYWNAIRAGASCLAGGGLVVFPTETVYGVGASATHPEGLARLKELKERQGGKPFTVHVGSRKAVDRFVPGLEGRGRRFVDKAWPGPLTLIFEVPEPSKAAVIQEYSPEAIPAMYHEGTIGIRYPDDRSAADLLTEAKVPVVAASANLAGGPPPLNADEALAQLDGQVDLVLDGGHTRYGKASTIVRLSGPIVEVLREGVIEERTIQRLTAMNFMLVCTGNTCRSPMAAGLLHHLLAEKLECLPESLTEHGYHVESAGLGAFGGSPASDEAVQIMKKRGIDISDHRSQPVDREQLARSDYVFAMTESHTRQLKALTKGATTNIRRLDEKDIEDPIGGDNSIYARCADQIEKALRQQLSKLSL